MAAENMQITAPEPQLQRNMFVPGTSPCALATGISPTGISLSGVVTLASIKLSFMSISSIGFFFRILPTRPARFPLGTTSLRWCETVGAASYDNVNLLVGFKPFQFVLQNTANNLETALRLVDVNGKDISETYNGLQLMHVTTQYGICHSFIAAVFLETSEGVCFEIQISQLGGSPNT